MSESEVIENTISGQGTRWVHAIRLGEPVEIPGVGLYVSFLDTDGNRVSMLHPFMR